MPTSPLAPSASEMAAIGIAMIELVARATPIFTNLADIVRSLINGVCAKLLTHPTPSARASFWTSCSLKLGWRPSNWQA
jgi:hypothetical protein